jgi:hypothetical protein
MVLIESDVGIAREPGGVRFKRSQENLDLPPRLFLH